MTRTVDLVRRLRAAAAGLVLGAGLTLSPIAAEAQVTAFMQAVAETASNDRDLAAFYRGTGYTGIWTGDSAEHRQRRTALLAALQRAEDHGLPASAYDVSLLAQAMRNIGSERELGRIEVELSRLFLEFAGDVGTGILTPSEVDSGLKREVPLRDRTELLQQFVASQPAGFLRSLAPQSTEYARLMRAKLELERRLQSGGWGPTVPAGALEPGQSGQAVVALRNRLIAMGYMGRSATAQYDADLQKAVQLFQIDNGLEADGVAGPATMTQINNRIEDRLPSILVALERERWLNMDLGSRHVWVNLTDFKARLVDDGKVTFETRSVIGKNVSDRRTPEFSDVMEYMEINPYWNVPRSIAVNEYLPRMMSNPGAAGHLQLVDGRGRVVSRGAVNWARYSARTFPFNLRQAPGRGNALGLVKFMFPNRHNIYLHDTPSKSLFQRERRDFSHGCIRLNDPFDFAYALLAKQEADPVNFFQSHLRSGRNTRVNLNEPVPVHLVYRTAYTSARGRLNFRHDIYGRDGRIFDALRREGVTVGVAGG